MPKIDGELKRAQLEIFNSVSQPSGLPAAPQPVGRVATDLITNPAVPRQTFWNGSAWVPIAFTSDIISPNVTFFAVTATTQSTTINWANGTSQVVLLQSSTTFTFTNPVAGQVHTLIVKSNPSTGVFYQYNFANTDLDPNGASYQPARVVQGYKNRVYQWYYSLASVAQNLNASVTSANAFGFTAAAHVSAKFSPDGTTVLAGKTATPADAISLRDVMTSFGSGVTAMVAGALNEITPAAATAGQSDIAYHPSGNAVFWGTGSTPFINGYFTGKMNIPFGTIWANPATLPPGAVSTIDISPDGYWLIAAGASTPFMRLYEVAFGTYSLVGSNPTTVPAGTVFSARFSPFGDYIAMAVAATPFLQVYPFTGTGTSGAIGSAPVVAPSSTPSSVVNGPQSLAWHPSGNWVAFLSAAAPYLYIYPFNRATGTFGVPISTNLFSSTLQSVAWTPDGQFLICGGGAASSTTNLFVLNCTTIAAPTLVTMPTSTVTGPVNAITVSPSGTYALVWSNVSPWVYVLTLPSLQKNYTRIYSNDGPPGV